jgi:4-diphosphocytidyl-2-C-methyl-D-erythritol kinase
VTPLRAWCPAKVNLGLRVLGRRDDGYHEIVTIFQTIACHDRLEVEPASDLGLDCDDPAVPAGEHNLVVRVARSIQRHHPAARSRGARFRLSKAIPAGGGLGGGSSNAAAAILLVDRLWDLGLTPAERSAIAIELGSDVNFFLTGGTALGTGRGETVRSLRPILERAVVLGLPPFALGTAEVYARLVAPLTPRDEGVTVPRLFVKFAEGNDFGLATNDLEAPAFAACPELAAFRDAMSRSGAELALLSGSGSSVFGMFREERVASEAAGLLAKAFAGWRIVPTRTVASGVRIEEPGPS